MEPKQGDTKMAAAATHRDYCYGGVPNISKLARRIAIKVFLFSFLALVGTLEGISFLINIRMHLGAWRYHLTTGRNIRKRQEEWRRENY